MAVDRFYELSGGGSGDPSPPSRTSHSQKSRAPGTEAISSTRQTSLEGSYAARRAPRNGPVIS